MPRQIISTVSAAIRRGGDCGIDADEAVQLVWNKEQETKCQAAKWEDTSFK